MKDYPTFEFLSNVFEKPFNGEDGCSNLYRRIETPAREPIEELLNRTVQHDKEQASSLQSFVGEIDRDISHVKRELSAPDGEIRVMICHGAKGLQSPIVIVPVTTSAVSLAGFDLFRYGSAKIDDYGMPLWSVK